MANEFLPDYLEDYSEDYTAPSIDRPEFEISPMDVHKRNMVDKIYQIDELVAGHNPEENRGFLERLTDRMGRSLQGNKTLEGQSMQNQFESVPGLTPEDVEDLSILRTADPTEYSYKLEALANDLSSQELVEKNIGGDGVMKVALNSIATTWSNMFGVNSDIVSDVEELQKYRTGIDESREVVGEEGAQAWHLSGTALDGFSRRVLYNEDLPGLEEAARFGGVSVGDARRYRDVVHKAKKNPDDPALAEEARALAAKIEADGREWRTVTVETLLNNLGIAAERQDNRPEVDLETRYLLESDNLRSWWNFAKESPLNTTLEMIAQSAGPSINAIGGTIVGALVGGAAGQPFAGAAAGSGTAAYKETYNNMFVDELIAAGLDLTNPEGLYTALTPERVDDIHNKINRQALYTAGTVALQSGLMTKPLAIGVPKDMGIMPGYISLQNTFAQTTIQAATDAAEAVISPAIAGGDLGTMGSALGAAQSNFGMIGLEPVQVGAVRGAAAAGESFTGVRDAVNRLRDERRNKAEGSAISNMIEDLGDSQTISETAQAVVSDVLSGLGDVSNIEAELGDIQAQLEATGDIGGLRDIQGLSPDAQTVPMTDVDVMGDQVWEIFPDPQVAAVQQLEEARNKLEVQRDEARATQANEGFGQDAADIADEGLRIIDEAVGQLPVPDARSDVGQTTKQKITFKLKDQDAVASMKEDGDVVLPVDGKEVTLETTFGKYGETKEGTKVGEGEVKRILSVLADTDATLEDKLGAVYEGYLKGVIATNVVKENRSQQAFVEALHRGDGKRLKELADQNERYLFPYEKIKEKTLKIQSSSTADLDGIIGVYRGKDITASRGWFHKLINYLPDSIYNSRSDTAPGQRGPIARGVAKAGKVIGNLTTQFGARGGGAKLMAEQYRAALARTSRILERMREMQKRHDGVFPSSMTNEQLNAINDYSREPTRQNKIRLANLDPEWVFAIDERREFRKELTEVLKEIIPADDKLIEIFDKNMDGYWHTFYTHQNPESAYNNATPAQLEQIKNILIDRFQPGNLFDPTFDDLMTLPVKDLRRLGKLRNVRTKPNMTKPQLADAIVAKGPLNEGDMKNLVQTTIFKANEWVDTTLGDVLKEDSFGTGEDAGIFSKSSEIRRKAWLSAAAETDPLAAALQAVYGKVRHPDMVFQSTIIKMANLIENYQSTQAMIQVAFELGIASLDQAKTGYQKTLDVTGEHNDFTYEIPGVGRVHPSNVYVSEEVADLFGNMFNANSFRTDESGAARFGHALVAMNNMYKYMYTIGNIPAHMRNWASMAIILSRNGTMFELHKRMDDVARGVGVLLKDFANSDSGGALYDLKHLMVDKRILHDSPKGGTLDDYVRDALSFFHRFSSDKEFDPIAATESFFNKWTNKIAGKAGEKVAKGVKGVVGSLEDSYRYTDEFPKIVTFLTERHFYADLLDRSTGEGAFVLKNMKEIIAQGAATTVTREHLQKAGIEPTPENLRTAQNQLDVVNDLAAKETLAITPTYSFVGPAMKALRSFPLLAPFPSFTSEVYRNHANAIKRAALTTRAAVRGKMEISVNGRDFTINVPRSLLSNRSIKQTAGLAADASGVFMGKMLAVAAMSTGGGDDDSSRFMDGVQGLFAQARDNGIIQERGKAKDFTAFGKSLLGPYVDPYGLVAIDMDPESNSITYLDVSYTHPNAPIYSGVEAMTQVVGNWNKPDVDALSGVIDAASRAFGPMLGIEPGTDQLFTMLTDRNAETTPYVGGAQGFTNTLRDFVSNSTASWIKRVRDDVAREGVLSWATGKTMSGTKVYEVPVPLAMNKHAVQINRNMQAHEVSFVRQVAKAASPAEGNRELDEESVREAYTQWRLRDGRALVSTRRLSLLAQDLLGKSHHEVARWMSHRDVTEQDLGLSVGDATELSNPDALTLPFRMFEDSSFTRIEEGFRAGTGYGIDRALEGEMLQQAEDNLRAAANVIYRMDEEFMRTGQIDGVALFEYN